MPYMPGCSLRAQCEVCRLGRSCLQRPAGWQGCVANGACWTGATPAGCFPHDASLDPAARSSARRRAPPTASTASHPRSWPMCVQQTCPRCAALVGAVGAPDGTGLTSRWRGPGGTAALLLLRWHERSPLPAVHGPAHARVCWCSLLARLPLSLCRPAARPGQLYTGLPSQPALTGIPPPLLISPSADEGLRGVGGAVRLQRHPGGAVHPARPRAQAAIHHACARSHQLAVQHPLYGWLLRV